ATQITASLYDSNGNLLQTITLIDKGGYYSGNFVAPSATGNYSVVVEATGFYNGPQFSRTEFESMNVISDSHLFLNDFADSSVDTDGDG
ncbi:MAG: hypothetical protein N2445_06390, partial [Acidobacteria bacterium]|nr:hypothetical protein [Acidobacteriota bacterium]